MLLSWALDKTGYTFAAINFSGSVSGALAVRGRVDSGCVICETGVEMLSCSDVMKIS